MSRRKTPPNPGLVYPAGKLTAVLRVAADVDVKPYDDTDIVFPRESRDVVYTSFDLSVLKGLEKTKR
jgi:hypothetical protein